MGILAGKIAIVTGAGNGLGVGEAIALAKEGAAVAVVDKDFPAAQHTAEQIELLGGSALAVECDVRRQSEVGKAVELTVARYGSVDILVNNAQMLPGPHELESWSDEEMRSTWESGPLGAWYFMQACFPHMKEKGGRVINLCSPAGHGRMTGYVGYSMAKEAMRSLTRCGAREWGRYGITVNSLSPVGMSAAAKQIYATEAMQQQMLEQIGTVLRRFGDPEADIGRAVVYLAGPDGGFVTGCTLSVDGGCAML